MAFFISLTDKIDDPRDVNETDRSIIVLYFCTYGIKTFKAGLVHRLCKKNFRVCFSLFTSCFGAGMCMTR